MNVFIQYMFIQKISFFVLLFTFLVSSSDSKIITADDFEKKRFTLTGNVRFEGKVDKRISIPMDSDPECGLAHKHNKALFENFIVDKNNNLKNVLVWVDGIDYRGDVISEPAIIDQSGCIYKPHIQGIMTNQQLIIKNSDQIVHTVRSMSNINDPFKQIRNRKSRPKNVGGKIVSRGK